MVARRSPCSSFKVNLEGNSACFSARTEPAKRAVVSLGPRSSLCRRRHPPLLLGCVWEETSCISEFHTGELKVFLSDCLGQLCMRADVWGAWAEPWILTTVGQSGREHPPSVCVMCSLHTKAVSRFLSRLKGFSETTLVGVPQCLGLKLRG